MYSYAYFMAGRVEDAWRMQERKPRENYRRQDYIWRAMLLAVVERTDDATRPWRTRLPISHPTRRTHQPESRKCPSVLTLSGCEPTVAPIALTFAPNFAPARFARNRRTEGRRWIALDPGRPAAADLKSPGWRIGALMPVLQELLG